MFGKLLQKITGEQIQTQSIVFNFNFAVVDSKLAFGVS